MYRLYRFASMVIPRLPRGFVLALSRVIGLVAWLVARKARRQATINMLHVLGPEMQATRAGRKRLRRTVRGMFLNSVRNYLEVLYLPSMKPEQIVRLMPGVEGVEYLDAALAAEKGVILISAHFGPFEYLAQWIAIKGYEMTIPVERLKDERMLDLMLKLRGSQGVHFIPLGGSAPMRSIIQALRKNQIVLITGDRAVQGESVEKPFFGELARLPIGPVSITQRTGAALVGALGWHASRTEIAGRFTPISLALKEEQRADSDMLMDRVIAMMEGFIKAHPEQWVVFEPVWVVNQGDRKSK
jgi:lauroyl/myristoyl acyltransferase